MRVIDKAIAKTVPLVPQPIVGRIASLYVAGARLEEAVPVIQDLNRQGCVATVDVLGEFTESKPDYPDVERVQGAAGRHSPA